MRIPITMVKKLFVKEVRAVKAVKIRNFRQEF